MLVVALDPSEDRAPFRVRKAVRMWGHKIPLPIPLAPVRAAHLQYLRLPVTAQLLIYLARERELHAVHTRLGPAVRVATRASDNPVGAFRSPVVTARK